MFKDNILSWFNNGVTSKDIADRMSRGVIGFRYEARVHEQPYDLGTPKIFHNTETEHE
jgi:hypothetical protein